MPPRHLHYANHENHLISDKPFESSNALSWSGEFHDYNADATGRQQMSMIYMIEYRNVLNIWQGNIVHVMAGPNGGILQSKEQEKLKIETNFVPKVQRGRRKVRGRRGGTDAATST